MEQFIFLTAAATAAKKLTKYTTITCPLAIDALTDLVSATPTLKSEAILRITVC